MQELYRILFGEADTATLPFFVEIVFRTVVMYAYTIVLARLVGKGGVGQIGPFEFVLVIAVGSAAGDPMIYPDVALLHGIVVITVVILLHRLTTSLLNRHDNMERLLEGEPLLVVENGVICEDRLGAGALTKRELISLLRQAGIRHTSEVECAWFEPSGHLSIFRGGGITEGHGVPTFPDRD